MADRTEQTTLQGINDNLHIETPIDAPAGARCCRIEFTYG